MTKFRVEEDRGYITLSAIGHAGNFFIDKDGNNMVCAIVSTLMQVAYLGCCEYTDECSVIKYYDGCYSFKCRSNTCTRAIIKTALIGLREASKQFPDSIQEEVS